MEMGSLLVILALVIVVGAIIARPLFDERDAEMDSGDPRQSILLAEEEKVLVTLQELDMDHAMGKIPSAEYQAQRAALVAEGAALLQAIDETGRGDSVGTRPALESMAGKPQAAAAAEDDIEAEIARRRQGRAGSGGHCVRCGKPVVAGDRFCSHCGAALAVGALAR
jgi:hypothetical protein